MRAAAYFRAVSSHESRLSGLAFSKLHQLLIERAGEGSGLGNQRIPLEKRPVEIDQDGIGVV